MAIKIGIQLYSVRNEMEKDPLATIKQVGDIGYKYIEFANHRFKSDPGTGFGVGKELVKELMTENDLHFVNCHIADVIMGPNNEMKLNYEFTADDFKRGLEYHQTIGNNNFTIAIDFFDNSKDSILKKCEQYNALGKVCHELGGNLVYHNHFEEFVKFGEDTIWDLLVSNTDPDYLSFEFDTFWAARGGVDPVEVIKKHGPRIRFLHQKDFAKDSKTPLDVFDALGQDRKDGNTSNKPITMDDLGVVPTTDFVEIGMGTLPIQDYIDAAAKYSKVEYILLEQDHTLMASQMDSVKASKKAFEQFSGIEF